MYVKLAVILTRGRFYVAGEKYMCELHFKMQIKQLQSATANHKLVNIDNKMLIKMFKYKHFYMHFILYVY